MRPKVHHIFDVPVDPGAPVGPGLTRTEFAAECDINLIMKDALRTGTIKQRMDMARYGDFSQVEDFHSAQNIVIRANAQFAALPSDLRKRFDNEPAKFLDWIHSKDTKLEDLHAYGLLSDVGIAKVEARKVKPPEKSP